jgi:hypothetical protein
MFLDDVPVNYMAVIIAAVAYFILGAIWYAPTMFGSRWMKHEWGQQEQKSHFPRILAYLGEMIIALMMAYILALFIEITHATDMLEGVVVALWVWLGFIATTHFSAVLWGRKTLKSFFIHAGFILLGLLIMGTLIPLLKFWAF